MEKLYSWSWQKGDFWLIVEVKYGLKVCHGMANATLLTICHQSGHNNPRPLKR
jgi:hypothetical protein